MLGAFAGDMIGSLYEHRGIKTVEFPLFQERSTYTDDSVLTAAVAYAVLNGLEYGPTIKDFGRRYPRRGYGGNFRKWLYRDPSPPYNSWGNGSAMRVSPVGYAFDTTSRVLEEAKRSAEVTHNHPEGIKGAQAAALAVFLAREGQTKEKIRDEISQRFEYNLSRTVEDIRPGYSFDVSCMGTVPEAIIAFLDSTDLEDALRLAVSLGGDADTLACISGSIAEAYDQSVPDEIERQVRTRLPDEFIEIMERFYERYIPW